MDPAGLRPLGVGETLDVAIKIYRSRFGVLVKAVAVVLAPVFVLTAAISLSIPRNQDLFRTTQPGATPEFDAGDFWTFLACIVPGVYLYVAWGVATPVLLLEGVRGRGALKRSRALVRDRWWPTCAVLVLVGVLTGIVSGVFAGLLVGVVGAADNEVASAVANAVGQTASSALTTP